MEFSGGFRDDIDMIAGYDQAHAEADMALRDSRAFFLIVLKNDDTMEAHVGASASISEVEEIASTAANVSTQILRICNDESG